MHRSVFKSAFILGILLAFHGSADAQLRKFGTPNPPAGNVQRNPNWNPFNANPFGGAMGAGAQVQQQNGMANMIGNNVMANNGMANNGFATNRAVNNGMGNYGFANNGFANGLNGFNNGINGMNMYGYNPYMNGMNPYGANPYMNGMNPYMANPYMNPYVANPYLGNPMLANAMLANQFAAQNQFGSMPAYWAGLNQMWNANAFNMNGMNGFNVNALNGNPFANGVNGMNQAPMVGMNGIPNNPALAPFLIPPGMQGFNPAFQR